jgi:hypothetical protein
MTPKQAGLLILCAHHAKRDAFGKHRMLIQRMIDEVINELDASGESPPQEWMQEMQEILVELGQ